MRGDAALSSPIEIVEDLCVRISYSSTRNFMKGMNLDTACERLREAVLEDRLIVLIGAGASADEPANLPVWSQLIEKMCTLAQDFQPARAALMRDELQAGNFLAAADIFVGQDRIPKRERAEFFRKTFDQLPSNIIPGTYSKLAAFPARHWITTNFDPLLGRALRARQSDGSGSDPEIIDNSTSHLISALELWRVKRFGIHLHGRAFSYDTLVYTTDTYRRIEALQQYKEILRRTFLESSILAYGFSFNDPAFIKILRYVADELGGATERIHFMLSSGEGQTPAELLRRANVVQLIYSDDDNHREGKELLRKLLDCLKGTRQSAAKPGSTTREREIQTLTHIFMSVVDPMKGATYESACASLARRVLEKAGKPLDQDQLISGMSSLANVSREVAGSMLKRGLPLFARVFIDLNQAGFFKANNGLSVTNSDIEGLVRVVETRFRTFKTGSISREKLHSSIREAISRVMVSQGMTIARAFANEDQPESYALVPLVEGAVAAANTPIHVREPLTRSIVEILASPPPECGSLLFRLAHAAYALETVFLNPTDPPLGRTLRWRIYLDSNVVLRLVAPNESQRSLRELVTKLVALAGC